MNWSIVIAKFVSMLMSWLDASNLRNRVYHLQEENEALRLALDDIRRMDPEGRVGWYDKSVLDRVDRIDQ